MSYQILIRIITGMSTFVFIYTLIILLIRLGNSNNGLRSFYYAYLPVVAHAVIYSIITQIMRYSDVIANYQLELNIWSATLRLHFGIALWLFIREHKPLTSHDWYDELLKKTEILRQQE